MYLMAPPMVFLPYSVPCGPAQHFHALHVEHVEQAALRSRDVDVIQVHADARVHAPQRIGLADAADVGGDGAAGTARGVDGEVGHLRIQVARSSMLSLSSESAVNAVTATGTSCSVSSRLRAVTVIVSSFASAVAGCVACCVDAPASCARATIGSVADRIAQAIARLKVLRFISSLSPMHPCAAVSADWRQR
jgi:hypothetical protein